MLLRNDFHNTEVQVNLRGRTFLTPYQVRRAWKTLCGIRTCVCSGALGTRGPQRLEGRRVVLTPCQDGTVMIEDDSE